MEDPNNFVYDRNLVVESKLDEPNIRWWDARRAPFRVYGLMQDPTTSAFCRIPADVAATVSPGVERLAWHTAGGRLRFCTDSEFIAIKAVMPYMTRQVHQPFNHSAGFDLYLDAPDEPVSRFYRVFAPPMESEGGYESIVKFPNRALRYFTIHFPSYSPVDALYIGLHEEATVGEGRAYRNTLPIVYYGSSITQGACASRSGNTYTNLLCRRLDRDYINLGFSGCGRAEESIARYMASLPMSVFVSDYDHNAPTPAYLSETHLRLYRIIRAAQPTVPYIILSRPDTDAGGSNGYAGTLQRRSIILKTFETARAEGDRNVYFVDGERIFCGPDADACTVDSIHPNDLGSIRIANALEPVFRRIILTGGMRS